MTADDPQIPGPRPYASEVEAEADDFLAAYRDSQALPDAVKARVRQRLLVAGAPAPEAAAPPQLDQARRRRSAIDQRWWIAAAALVLLASAAIALLPGRQEGIVASRRGVDGAAYTADDRALRGDAQTGVGDAPDADDRAVLPPAEGSVQAGAATLRPTAEADAATRPAPQAPQAPTTTATAEDRPLKDDASARRPGAKTTAGLDLAAEKALLEGAWRALAAGDHQRAREALRRHRDDFADGILSQEREVLEVLLACKTAAPGASQQAARFRREHPESPWRPRLDEVCPASPSPE
jgi:hypothetical protein